MNRLIVLVKRKVGLGSEPVTEQLHVTLHRTMEIGELYNTRRTWSSIDNRMGHNNKSLNFQFSQKQAAVKREEANLKQIEKEYASSKKTTTKKKKVLDDAKAKVASAEAEYNSALQEQLEHQDDLAKEEAQVAELKEAAKKLSEDIVKNEHNKIIKEKMMELHKTVKGRAKLPLGKDSGATAEDYHLAVAKLVPNMQALADDCDEKDVRKAMTFLWAGGVEAAILPKGTGKLFLALAKRTLAEILFPDQVPERQKESPNSKAKAIAKSLFEDAAVAETVVVKKRKAKRKSLHVDADADADAVSNEQQPPAKKTKKMTPKHWAIAKATLSADVFAMIRDDVVSDVEAQLPGDDDDDDDDEAAEALDTIKEHSSQDSSSQDSSVGGKAEEAGDDQDDQDEEEEKEEKEDEDQDEE